MQAGCSDVGVFDLPSHGSQPMTLDLGDTWNHETLQQSLRQWTRDLHVP